MGKLRVLTICSVQQSGGTPLPPCSGPQGSSLLIEMSLCCRLLLIKAVTPQTGAQLLQANSESLCKVPTMGGLLSSELGSVLHHHPTSPHKPPFSHVAGKPAFCRKLEGRAERVPCSVLIGRPVWAGVWPSWAAWSVHVG